MKHQNFSDTIELRHYYLEQPSIALEDRIVQAMSILTCTINNSSAATCNTQLNAITDLRYLFGQQRYLIALPSPVPDTRVVPPTPPTFPPNMTCNITSIPHVSLPTTTPSSEPTKQSHVRTYRALPRSPREVPTQDLT